MVVEFSGVAKFSGRVHNFLGGLGLRFSREGL